MEISRCKIADLLWSARPLEPAAGNSLIQEQESVALIDESLHPVGTRAAEEIQAPLFEWVESEVILDDLRKPVDPTTQVGTAASYIDVLEISLLKHCAPPGSPW